MPRSQASVCVGDVGAWGTGIWELVGGLGMPNGLIQIGPLQVPSWAGHGRPMPSPVESDLSFWDPTDGDKDTAVLEPRGYAVFASAWPDKGPNSPGRVAVRTESCRRRQMGIASFFD